VIKAKLHNLKGKIKKNNNFLHKQQLVSKSRPGKNMLAMETSSWVKMRCHSKLLPAKLHKKIV